MGLCEDFKKKVLEYCQRVTTSSSSTPNTSTTTMTPPAEIKPSNVNVPLSQLFKKPEGSWNCNTCYLSNDKNATSCISCQTVRPGYENTKVEEAPTQTSAPTTAQPTFSFGFPTVKPMTPPEIKPVATVDETPKKSEETASPFTGLNLSGKFSFADLAKNNNSSFTFGNNTSTPSFTGTGSQLFSSFANKSSSSDTADAKNESVQRNTSATAEDGEDDFVPTAEFQPVIPLPPLVEVKKGDENENTIVEYRAKLYRFVAETKEWKERGVGQIKLLQSKEDPSKCRVVMWREKIGKLACNFSLFPDMKISNYQNNPKVLTWKCQDFSEDLQWETFTARFGSEEGCEDFKKKVLEYAQNVSASNTSIPATTPPATPPSENNSSATTANAMNVPLSQLFKKPEGSWNCNVCYLTNDKNAYSCVSCETVRPGYENKKAEETPAQVPAIQPTFSFGFPTAPSITPVETKPDVNAEEVPNKNDETASPFSGLNLAGKFSFADLAKNNNSSFTFGNTTSTPSFTGTGSQLFSSFMNKSSGANDSKNDSALKNTSGNAEEGEDDFVPTAEFQPVIPLPPLVEVKKGDENENTIVEYRAKLYRFVAETKEWKERGVGQIKLLQSKEDPSKCRVVMWREKIGKLACNFSLFSDIKITNYQSNPKVLTWRCHDFAEEPQWQTFTARFGNEEGCEDFKKKILEYAQGGSSLNSSVTSTDEKSPGCPGCIGCDSDSFAIPEIKVSNEKEALIDLPLSPDASSEVPFRVTMDMFDPRNDKKSNSFQVVPEVKKETSPVPNSGTNNLSSFSFSFKTPEKTDSNASPISFQFKTPTFSFQPNESSTKIFGGSIFSPPGTVAGSATQSESNNNPSPFVSPFAQSSVLNNSTSSPPVFNFSQSNFQQSPAAVNPAPKFTNDNEEDNDDESENREDDYEDVDDEEDECMFEEEAHIYIQNEAESAESFIDKGEGVVRVLYDGESYCGRLVVVFDSDVFTDHLVASDTNLKPTGDNLTYEWNGICNYKTNTAKSRIRAVFPSEDAYHSFATVMQESLEFAEQAGITEAILLEESYQ